MDEETQNRGVVNHFEKDSNCQVFNGDVTGCVFAMPGSVVTQQQAGQMTESNSNEEHGLKQVIHSEDEKLCFFVHPAIDESNGWLIHGEIKRLVARQGVQEICKYLSKLKDEQKILLPQSAEKAYNELVRMGMPNGEGYKLKTFMKYYKR